MQKKQVFFAVAFVCLLAAGWGYYLYQKPRAAAAHEPAAYTVTAEQLFTEYNTAEPTAEQKYGGKVIAVTGTVADVQPAGKGTNVLLAAGAAGGVNCSMSNLEKEIAPGARVTLKGRCTGFLMDVSLVDAVRVDN